jgi:hypothetical protein
MLENTARDPLARAKRVAVDNGKYKKKQVKTGEENVRVKVRVNPHRTVHK